VEETENPHTDHSSRKDPCRKVGVQETAGYRAYYWTAIGSSNRLFYYTYFKYWVSESELCIFSSLGTNAFRMNSCNSSFTMKSCACATVTSLAGYSAGLLSIDIVHNKVKRCAIPWGVCCHLLTGLMGSISGQWMICGGQSGTE